MLMPTNIGSPSKSRSPQASAARTFTRTLFRTASLVSVAHRPHPRPEAMKSGSEFEGRAQVSARRESGPSGRAIRTLAFLLKVVTAAWRGELYETHCTHSSPND